MNLLKSICMVFLGLNFFMFVRAQEAEAVLAKVFYKFIYVNDTTQRAKHLEEEMVLYIAKGASFYASNVEQRMKEQMEKQMNDPAFDGNIELVGNRVGMDKESVYLQPSDRLCNSLYQLAGQQYLVDTDFPDLDWIVTSETKEIGGYRSQQATTHFKGRDYVVWFTTELPFQYGPWKLQGLPGLILEAEDSKSEIVFQYAGFDKEDGSLSMCLPDDLIKTDLKALERLKAAFKKNPSEFLAARPQASKNPTPVLSIDSDKQGNSVSGNMDPSRIKSINVRKVDNDQMSTVFNNPIEIYK